MQAHMLFPDSLGTSALPMLDDIAPSPRLWEQLTAASTVPSDVTPQRQAQGPGMERTSRRSH